MIFGVRPTGRILKAAFGFAYDFARYVRYANWRNDLSNKQARNYSAVKTYHALEKSMSFKNRRISSGWDNALILTQLCEVAAQREDLGFHDTASLSVLRQFIAQDGNCDRAEADEIGARLNNIHAAVDDTHGTHSLTYHDLQQGKLDNPAKFFESRYSLREFRDTPVSDELIRQAVELAMRAPSACNRQPWGVYSTNDRAVIDTAMHFQTGNKGFGDSIPNLLVVTTDLQAFVPGEEHYQHWIDGGIFSMSLVLALHALGLGSCCLNWSQKPQVDLQIRNRLKFRPSDTIIMMLAVGWPNDDNNVCKSARKPIDEVVHRLEFVSS